MGQGRAAIAVALAFPMRTPEERKMNVTQESYSELFADLASNLVTGRASITSTSFADREQVDLTPENPRAARIRAILPKNRGRGITLVIGTGTIFEIPDTGGRYTECHSAVEEARTISMAVIAGRFTERVRIGKKDRVVSSVGTVDIPPPVTVRWRRLRLNPFQRTSVKHIKYEPY